MESGGVPSAHGEQPLLQAELWGLCCSVAAPSRRVSDGRPGLFHDFFLWFHKSRRGEHSQRLTTSERNILLSCSLLRAPDAGDERVHYGPWPRACQWWMEPRRPYLPWGIKVILLLPGPRLKHRLSARNLRSLIRRVSSVCTHREQEACESAASTWLQIGPWAPALEVVAAQVLRWGSRIQEHTSCQPEYENLLCWVLVFTQF